MGEPLATMIGAVVFLSRAEAFFHAVASRSTSLCAWHIFSFLESASAHVEKDISRAHFDGVSEYSEERNGGSRIDAQEP